jgi:hypothetical protein
MEHSTIKTIGCVVRLPITTRAHNHRQGLTCLSIVIQLSDSALHHLLHIGERERWIAVTRKGDDLRKEAGLILCPSEVIGPVVRLVEESDKPGGQR